MIKEIEKPNIDFKFFISDYINFKYYYNKETNEYFIESKNKSKIYFNLEGNAHRIGKPAIEYYDGVKIWAENGKEHRLDGPSFIYKDHLEFHINNKSYFEAKFAEKTNHLICKFCGQFCKQSCFF